MSSRAVAVGGTDPSAENAYAACRRMLLRRDPTYALAVLRLPAVLRPSVYALYGFARGADDIVDGRRRATDPRARLAALDAWEQELERGLATGRSDHPILAALVDAGIRLDLPLEGLHDYMRSMRVDCAPVRVTTRAELDGYMEGIAGPIGRITASIFGAAPAREAFVRLGLAFQLTNLLRDVRKDYALDRIYLPAEERARFGVDESDLGRPAATPGLRALVAEEVGRARRHFAAGETALAAAPASARASMRLAQSVYVAVLDRIEAVGCDVLGHSTRPGPLKLARAAIGAVRGAA